MSCFKSQRYSEEDRPALYGVQDFLFYEDGMESRFLG